MKNLSSSFQFNKNKHSTVHDVTLNARYLIHSHIRLCKMGTFFYQSFLIYQLRNKIALTNDSTTFKTTPHLVAFQLDPSPNYFLRRTSPVSPRCAFRMCIFVAY